MSDINKNDHTKKVSHKFLIFFEEDRSEFSRLSQEIPQSIVVPDLDGNSNLYNVKWWRLSMLLAIFACFQIVREVSTTGDGTAEQHKPQVQFLDLYEASVLELQQGLDAGHFSSVDLVKVGYYHLKHRLPSSSEFGYRHISPELKRLT